MKKDNCIDMGEKIGAFEKTLNNVLNRLYDVEHELRNTKRTIDSIIDKMRIEESCVGFRGDEIFLPSIEEYEKYKDVIPRIHTFWWTRTQMEEDGLFSYIIETVGGISFSTNKTRDIAVRPMIHLPANIISSIGDKIYLYNFPWVVIDEHLAIAEVPIGFEKFDNGPNNYEESHIRKFLLDWLKERS